MSTVYTITTNSKPIAHNVSVVYDVFAVAMKELRSNSSNRKNVVE
jgi:hypothetical protein